MSYVKKLHQAILAGVCIGGTLAISTPTLADTQYTVQPGDSLWKLASAYQTSVNGIMSLNKLRSDMIFIDQNLQLPEKKATNSSCTKVNADCKSNQLSLKPYKVKDGDTLWGIAES